MKTETPPIKKRHSGPSGKPGRHKHPLVRFHAPAALVELFRRAAEHNAESSAPGGYAGLSDWARHHLAIAAADELGIDRLEALKLADE